MFSLACQLSRVWQPFGPNDSLPTPYYPIDAAYLLPETGREILGYRATRLQFNALSIPAPHTLFYKSRIYGIIQTGDIIAITIRKVWMRQAPGLSNVYTTGSA